MKRLLLLLAVLLCCHTLPAQETAHPFQSIEDRVRPTFLSCEDIARSSEALYVRYMQEQQTDSVQQLLEYWAMKCDRAEAVQRAITLFAISNGTYSNAVLSSHILLDIASYKNKVAAEKKHQPVNSPFYSGPSTNQHFDQFTRELATGMRDSFPNGSMEYFWCDFYGPNPDSIVGNITSPAYDSTEIRNIYSSYIREENAGPKANAAFITGVWIPTGSLSRLGIHPELGFQLGGSNSRWELDFTLLLRFGNSSTTYEARRIAQIQQTRFFLGGYMGLDLAYKLASLAPSIEMTALAGTGYDFITPFSDNSSNKKEDKVTSAGSYNFNFGLGFRKYYSRSFYVGTQIRYNIVDYTLNDIMQYKGNTFAVRFYIGGAFYRNPAKEFVLDALEE